MNKIITLISAATLIVTGTPAWSQSTTSDQVGQLEEITVTAQRREEHLQDLPFTITALEGDFVEEFVNRAEELSTLTTQVNVAMTGGMTQIYIRGVGNLGGTAYAEPAVAFNVDQVYVARPTTFDAVYFDLERVEILKGPQGTLYGRNATGGAINVITRKPELGEFGGYGSLDIGNFNLIKATAAVNVPLAETVAARISAQTVDHDGYLSDGYNDQNSEAARLHLKFEPTDTFSLLLSAEYAHQGGQADGYTPSFRTCGDWCGPSEPSNIALQKVGYFAMLGLINAVNDDGVGFQDNTYWSVSADMEADVGFGLLSVIPAHRNVDIDTLIYPSLFRGRILDESHQDSLEIRLASPVDSAVSWVAGAYYYNEKVNGNYAYSHGDGLQAQINEPDIKNESIAIFGQADWNLSDTVRLITGLRYTEDKKELGGTQRCYSGILCGAPLGSGLPGTSIQLDESDSWDNFSYRAGVQWDFADQSMAYATVSTAFKSGGFFPAAMDATFKPEDLTSYSLGVKNRLADGRVHLNAEVFYWDYKNHQEAHVGTACIATDGTNCTAYGNVYLTENVGKAKIKGIDIEAEFLITSNDFLAVKLGYLDAEATTFSYNVPAAAPPPAGIDCVVTPGVPLINVDCGGNTTPRAPKWTAAFSYTHTFDLESGAQVVAELSSYYSSEYWASINYTPGAMQDSYTKSNASITYSSPDNRWNLGLWISNIEDEPVMATHGIKIFAGTSGEQLRSPRTYGVRFRLAF